MLVTLLTAACGRKQVKVQVPPPPAPGPAQEPSTGAATPNGAAPQEAESEPAPQPSPRPVYEETGIASWYGPPYHSRRGANGEVYDMNAMTAAHRTLPLNTLVRVVNLKTGSEAVVRITDRGPFVKGRIIDLSLAAAKKLDVWRPGTAMVRLEVISTPGPLDGGGRWAVQIGGFEHQQEARQLQDRLSRRYHRASVLAFPSPTGAWWVRIRVPDDDKARAQEVAQNAPAAADKIFLVRLD